MRISSALGLLCCGAAAAWAIEFKAPAASPAYQDAGDYLLFGGRKIPVLRHPRKVVAFERAGTTAATGPLAAPAFRALRSGLVSGGARKARWFEAAQDGGGGVGGSPGLESLLRREKGVAFTRRVYYDAVNRIEFAPSERIAVKWRAAEGLPGRPADLESWARGHGLRTCGRLEENTFLFEMLDPGGDPLALASSLSGGAGVDWAEPELLFQPRPQFLPNDALFPDQQTLRNLGQNGNGTLRADVRADSAWDISQGDPAITIAILDDGVETTHPDLAPNIRAGGRNYTSVGSPSDPNPSDSLDNHGTAVAGVAAARGNNLIGVSGVAPRVKILPIKISGSQGFVSTVRLIQAVLWAADTLDVDILSNSWGLSPASNGLRDAIRTASTVGRGGRGSLVFFSSGNNGSEFKNELGGDQYAIPVVGGNVPPGSHRIGFRYKKNPDSTAGDDKMCIDNVAVTSGVIKETFSGAGLPSGWTTPTGAVAWQVSSGLFYSGAGDQHSLCSGVTGNNAASEVVLPSRTYNPGDFIFFLTRRSSHLRDSLQIRFYNSTGTALLDSVGIPGGVDAKADTIGFPASADSAIAVGSASEFDFRTGYSQFNVAGTGKTVDFLAPSDGAWVGVGTTDRTGANGYSSGDYTLTFGGTSAASPLAAGVAALVLSRHPNFTRNEVKDLLRRTCDKIGGAGVVYSPAGPAGSNREYGFGRLNAFKALFDLPDNPPVFTPLPDTFVSEGQALQLTLKATDVEGDAMVFSVLDNLSGDTLVGPVFTWTPAFTDSGAHALRFVVRAAAKMDTDTVVVRVFNVDGPPAFAVLPESVKVYEGFPADFAVTAADPDGDPVTISSTLPPGAVLQGGNFHWTPGYADSGAYTARFVATAGGKSDTALVFFVVFNVDRPPVITTPGPLSVPEAQFLSFPVSAVDPDGDAVQIFVSRMPQGANFDGAVFQWTPTYVQAGAYAPRFYAVSHSRVDSQDVAINVTEAGTGLGTLRLISRDPGSMFYLMPAGDHVGDPLGLDSVDFRAPPGIFWFSLRRPGLRTRRFPAEVIMDSTQVLSVAMKSHVPWMLAEPETVSVSGAPWMVPDSALAVFDDLDFDGSQDLLLRTPAATAFYRNAEAIDTGYLRFAPADVFRFRPGVFRDVRGMASADWDLDGFYDFILDKPGKVMWVTLRGPDPGDSLLVYGDTTQLAAHAGNCQPRVGDADADGRKDLWLSCREDGLWLYRNTGNNSGPVIPSVPQEIKAEDGSSLSGLTSPVWVDFDGDGREDLLAFQAGRLKLFPGLPGALPAYGRPRDFNLGGRSLDCPACRLTQRLSHDGMPGFYLLEPGKPLRIYRARLAGDFNGDHRVDAIDRNILEAALEKRASSPGWNPLLNLALSPGGEERIDVHDLAAFADSWAMEE